MALPPRAPRLPVLGNALAYMRDPLGFLCRTRDRYGDVVRVALGPLEVTLVSDPALVEEILVSRSRLFQKDAFLDILRPVLGQGLLTSEGDFWRKQRRLAQPAFHRARIEAYGRMMSERAGALADEWRDGEERDVHEDMMRLTLEIVAQTLFGADVGGDARAVGRAIEDVLSLVSDPLRIFVPWFHRLPFGKQSAYDRAIRDLDRIVYGVIEQRRKRPEATDGGDLLAMLLAAEDEDGSRMSDKQLRDECMTVFLAGHETTAIHLTWTFYLLSKHPSVADAVRREIDDVVGDDVPRLEHVARLSLVKQVLAESLRLYPPAWSMGREASEDLSIGGYDVKKGDQLWFCPWSIQRDRRWFEDPNEFRPDRWEESKRGDLGAATPKTAIHRYAYFPFGGGPRFCIGQAFAQLEAAILLATFVQRFSLDVLPKPRVVAAPSVTLRPKKGVHVRVRRRSSATANRGSRDATAPHP